MQSTIYIISLLVNMAFAPNRLVSDLPDALIKAIENGNYGDLASHTSGKIEIVFPNTSGFYSREQASQMFSHFFTKNKPNVFIVTRYGKNGSSRYLRGTLRTQSGKYRVYVTFKTTDNQDYELEGISFEEE